MIQRIQSIYLLIGFILLIIFSLFNSLGILNNAEMVLIALSLFAGMDTLASIFLYKNRKNQLKVVYMAVGLTVAAMVYFMYTAGFNNFFNDPYFFLLPTSLLLQFLAIRAIKADENLIKSSYRLR